MGAQGWRVAVIIPAFRSERTIAGCLEALRGQTFKDYRTVVVDSSPDQLAEQVVRNGYPEVEYHHAPERLLPHAARNLGVERSISELLVFTDPDIYPAKEWLTELVEGYDRNQGVIVGTVACHNRDRLSRWIHLAKFDMWLPGGHISPVEISLTGNMLIDRSTFRQVGGLDGERMLADTLLSWCLESHGITKTLVPAALVAHDHSQTFVYFLRERLVRGHEFGKLRMSWNQWSIGRVLAQLVLSLVPLRLIRLTFRSLSNAWRHVPPQRALAALPVVVCGQAAWLLGEAWAYSAHILGQPLEADLPCAS